VSVMGLTRCYKTTVFYIYTVYSVTTVHTADRFRAVSLVWLDNFSLVSLGPWGLVPGGWKQ